MAAIWLPLHLLQGPRHPLLIGYQVYRLPVVTAPWRQGVLSRLNSIVVCCFTEIRTRTIFGRLHLTSEFVSTDFVAIRTNTFSFSPLKLHGTVICFVFTRNINKHGDNANDD